MWDDGILPPDEPTFPGPFFGGVDMTTCDPHESDEWFEDVDYDSPIWEAEHRKRYLEENPNFRQPNFSAFKDYKGAVPLHEAIDPSHYGYSPLIDDVHNIDIMKILILSYPAGLSVAVWRRRELFTYSDSKVRFKTMELAHEVKLGECHPETMELLERCTYYYEVKDDLNSVMAVCSYDFNLLQRVAVLICVKRWREAWKKPTDDMDAVGRKLFDFDEVMSNGLWSQVMKFV